MSTVHWKRLSTDTLQNYDHRCIWWMSARMTFMSVGASRVLVWLPSFSTRSFEVTKKFCFYKLSSCPHSSTLQTQHCKAKLATLTLFSRTAFSFAAINFPLFVSPWFFFIRLSRKGCPDWAKLSPWLSYYSQPVRRIVFLCRKSIRATYASA